MSELMISKQDVPIPDSGMIQDMRNAARIWGEGKDLCDRCKGTGNELFAMYRRCEDCGGSGEAQELDKRP